MTTQLDLLQRDWCDEAERLMLMLYGQNDTFTIDGLHAWIPKPPHPNWWGVLMAKLRATGRYENTGARRKSNRPSANGRKVPVWRVL